MTACPGCGRTTSSTFQELAERTQDYIRERMPEWKTQYDGVETMTLAVMGCVVNGPGESKAANIGISLPGTGEAPNCPVFIDGGHATTLRGTYEELAAAFRQLVDDYVARTYQKKAVSCPFFQASVLATSEKADCPLYPDPQQREAADHQSGRQAPPEADDAETGPETQHVAERQADQPVADEIPDHRRPRVGQVREAHRS